VFTSSVVAAGKGAAAVGASMVTIACAPPTIPRPVIMAAMLFARRFFLMREDSRLK
jgi:hypothetical protein